MHSWRLASSLLLSISLALVALGPGCGGTSDTGTGSGSPDGSDDGAIVFGDSPSGDVNTVPVGDGGDAGDPFCQAEAQFYQRCNLTAPCTQENLANCGQVSVALSDAARQAYVACLATDSCTQADGGKEANRACIASHLAGATPTAAQSSVRDKLCAVCAGDGGVTSCDATFFAQSDAGTAPVGDIVLFANDAIAAEVGQTCTGQVLADAGSTQQCDLKFFFCSAFVFGKHVPKDACTAPSDAGAGDAAGD